MSLGIGGGDDADGIGDDEGGETLFNGGDFGERNNELFGLNIKTKRERERSVTTLLFFARTLMGPWGISPTNNNKSQKTYIGDPSKDVCIEADVVLADEQSPLNEDLLLKSTTEI